jgi:hypothetical protein
VAGSGKHHKEQSGSIKDEEFLDHPIYFYIFKKAL